MRTEYGSTVDDVSGFSAKPEAQARDPEVGLASFTLRHPSLETERLTGVPFRARARRRTRTVTRSMRRKGSDTNGGDQCVVTDAN